ncbi:MAG: HNH endonuclease signature motif containing protein [Desulfobacteraceae bacterium]|nr:HNH endonuclease signature motif containing protein [Desulfobacteraceae bacterium]
MARKTFPTSKRAAIWRAHKRLCIYCTELVTFADLDVDHIVPNHLKDKPEQLSKLLDEYGLSNDFDVDGLLNLVPSHRHCNLQKNKKILSKSRVIHFLSIAESKYNKAREIEYKLKEQAKKDNFLISVQIALEVGLTSLNELTQLVNRYEECHNMFEVLTVLPFVNCELKGFMSSLDVESLYDLPILPRTCGLDKLTLVKLISHKEEKIEVVTCSEWVEAVSDGFYALTTNDIKEETLFKNVYSLVVALSQARTPKYSFISDQKVSIANFDLLPVTLLPALSSDSIKELQRLESEGIHIPDLIAQGRVKVVSSSPLTLTLHYDGMGLYLNEILRADLNDDGIEDLLLGSYEWALEGTFGAGGSVALTRLGIDHPFTVTEHIELNVRETWCQAGQSDLRKQPSFRPRRRHSLPGLILDELAKNRHPGKGRGGY